MRLMPAALDGPVRLLPFDENQREGLRPHVEANPSLWAWWPRGMANWDEAFAWQIAEHAAGRHMIHAVEWNGALVGQTCYLNIRPEHAGVEIGGTWYAPVAQGGLVNPTCKLAMLENAFLCGAERVELKTDAMNARSRAAIEKLGAQFEGVFRRHMRRPDGTWRDTAWYSVLREDWPPVKAGLKARIANV